MDFNNCINPEPVPRFNFTPNSVSKFTYPLEIDRELLKKQVWSQRSLLASSSSNKRRNQSFSRPLMAQIFNMQNTTLSITYNGFVQVTSARQGSAHR